MGQYNWTNHYAATLIQNDLKYPFRSYDITNETGFGKVISCDVFPGLQTVYNDLNMQYCGNVVPGNDGIVEISYCMEGRYECEVSNQYCFYVSHGDLSVGTVGCRESGGSFPTKSYSGLTIFLDAKEFKEQCNIFLREMKIELDEILKASVQYPRLCILHGNPDIDLILKSAIDAQTKEDISLLRLKILELLLLLGRIDFESYKDMPAYLNHTQAVLAKNVHQMLTSDLSIHLTLKTLSEELNASPTAIKNAFKTVYGESIRNYMKSFRINEAQRLLREEDRPVADVAAMVGYHNPGHFSAAFKEKYGISPGDHKKCVRFEQ